MKLLLLLLMRQAAAVPWSRLTCPASGSPFATSCTEPADAQGSLAVILRDRKRLIAAQLGIAPETFSRVLKHLRDRKLISGGGRVLNLLDLTGLQSLAGI